MYKTTLGFRASQAVVVPARPFHGAWARRLGLLVLAAAQLAAPSAASAARLEERLSNIPADDIIKDAALKKDAIVLGKKVYAAHCVACHGVNLKGVAGRHAPDLSDAATLYGSDNVDAEADQMFPSDMETTIKFGIRAAHPGTRKLAVMPGFAGLDPHQEGGYPTLTAQQTGDLAEFLVMLQNQPGDAASAARGKLLFADQGGCYDCHGRDARGNPGIGAPDLSASTYLYGNDRKAIMASIREGRKGVMPAYEGSLSAAQIKAAAVYLFSVWDSARK